MAIVIGLGESLAGRRDVRDQRFGASRGDSESAGHLDVLSGSCHGVHEMPGPFRAEPGPGFLQRPGTGFYKGRVGGPGGLDCGDELRVGRFQIG